MLIRPGFFVPTRRTVLSPTPATFAVAAVKRSTDSLSFDFANLAKSSFVLPDLPPVPAPSGSILTLGARV
jgi:hypothetical protein